MRRTLEGSAVRGRRACALSTVSDSQQSGRAARVAVVVLNFNGGEWLRRCLQSLVDSAGRPAAVIVVDNGSTDGSAGTVETEFPGARLIRNGSNLGFAAGCNVGIEAALNGGAEWTVLVNPDVRVEPHWLDELMRAAERRPQLGILAPVQLEYGSDAPNSWTRAVLPAPDNQSAAAPEPDTVVRVDQVEGSCMAVKRDVFDRVGLLDTLYGSFFEDYDLCRRARLVGFDVAVAARSRVHHARSAIWDATSERAREHWYRCERGQFIFAMTDPRRSAAGNLGQYVVTLASKVRAVSKAGELWRVGGLVRLQLDLLASLPSIMRKARRDRALICQALSTEP